MPDNPLISQEQNQVNPAGAPNKKSKLPAPVEKWWNWAKGITTLLLVVLVLVVALALYLSSKEPRVGQTIPSPQLIIVQLNDIYRLDSVRDGKRGGLARVASLLHQLKDQNPQIPLVVLHAGDFLSPSLESNVFHGMQMVDAMNFINEIAPLYVVPGNHEFDYSEPDKEYLTNAITRSKFQWVAANLDRNDQALLPALRQSVSRHVVIAFGKEKLGIFGLTIDGAQGGKNRSYAAISGDYARIAREEIEELEREGADIIVGLTHLNIGNDRDLAQLKRDHPRFLWIAGGHEHSLDREPQSAGTALITKGDSNARTVWKVSVVRNVDDFEVREESVVINESIPPDPKFKQDIEDFYRMKLRSERPYLDTVISTLPNRCYDGTEEAVRDRESDWGDFLTDTMRKAHPGIKADVAVLNGGSIRIDDTFCNRITFENLERTFAYDTPIVFVKLKGNDLKKYLLADSASSKRGDGRFLQVSGVSFRRDFLAKGNEVLQDLQLQSGTRQAKFVDSQTYVVVVNKFIFDCGDGYKFRPFVSEYIPDGPDLRALTYLTLSTQTKKTPTVTGRIMDLPGYVKPPSKSGPKWQKLSSNDQQCR